MVRVRVRLGLGLGCGLGIRRRHLGGHVLNQEALERLRDVRGRVRARARAGVRATGQGRRASEMFPLYLPYIAHTSPLNLPYISPISPQALEQFLVEDVAAKVPSPYP